MASIREQGKPDDVGIYLRQACSVEVLTPEEEADLARHMERYREGFRRRALSDPAVFDAVLERIEAVLDGRQRAETIFEASIVRDTSPSLSAKRARRYLPTLKDPDVPMDRKVAILDRLSIKLREVIRIWRQHGSDDPETRRLFRRWIRYRKKMARHNLRLVISICKRYKHASIPMIDLIQEGNLGLMRAIDKYEQCLGHKFSTYATWWIRQGITRVISEGSGLIRIPNHLANRLYKLRRKLNSEMAEPSQEQLDDLARGTQSYLSVDEMVVGSEDTFLRDLITDPHEPTPESGVDNIMLAGVLARAMRTISPRMVHLLRLRYGLGHADPFDSDQCARVLNVTRERIYQLEYQAMDILRRHGSIQRLAEA